MIKHRAYYAINWADRTIVLGTKGSTTEVAWIPHLQDRQATVDAEFYAEHLVRFANQQLRQLEGDKDEQRLRLP